MELSGKVALVTGAGRRVGRAIALGLAARGVTLAIHYRNSAGDASRTVAEIEGRGGKARAVRADLEKVSEIESLVDGFAAGFGRRDILVNCAAGVHSMSRDQVTEHDWD